MARERLSVEYVNPVLPGCHPDPRVCRPGRAPDATLERLGTGDARYLSTAVATGFTGVYQGCYATGNGEERDDRARILDFEYPGTVE